MGYWQNLKELAYSMWDNTYVPEVNRTKFATTKEGIEQQQREVREAAETIEAARWTGYIGIPVALVGGTIAAVKAAPAVAAVGVGALLKKAAAATVGWVATDAVIDKFLGDDTTIQSGSLTGSTTGAATGAPNPATPATANLTPNNGDSQSPIEGGVGAAGFDWRQLLNFGAGSLIGAALGALALPLGGAVAIPLMVLGGLLGQPAMDKVAEMASNAGDAPFAPAPGESPAAPTDSRHVVATLPNLQAAGVGGGATTQMIQPPLIRPPSGAVVEARR